MKAKDKKHRTVKRSKKKQIHQIGVFVASLARDKRNRRIYRGGTL